MAYLARLRLNPLRTGAQRLLRSPQAVHAALLGGFDAPASAQRVLWRLEPDGPHRLQLLALSVLRPSYEHIVEQAGWPSAEAEPVLVRDYTPLLERVVAGREFAFRLRANTVSSTRQPERATSKQREHLATDRPRGVRVPERTAAHQMAWFDRRLPGWGFEVVEQGGLPAVRLAGRERVQFRKGDADQRRNVVLQTATAEGIVRVVNAAAARSALVSGCGPGRAYGCGLLTLAPVRGSASCGG